MKAKKPVDAAMLDAMTYGTGIIKSGQRKWYNPMRWIKGKFYQKRIKPKDFFV